MTEPYNDPYEIARRVRAALAWGNLTREQGAEVLQVSIGTLDRIIGKRRGTPRGAPLPDLWRLADACGVPREWFSFDLARLHLAVGDGPTFARGTETAVHDDLVEEQLRRAAQRLREAQVRAARLRVEGDDREQRLAELALFQAEEEAERLERLASDAAGAGMTDEDWAAAAQATLDHLRTRLNIKPDSELARRIEQAADPAFPRRMEISKQRRMIEVEGAERMLRRAEARAGVTPSDPREELTRSLRERAEEGPRSAPQGDTARPSTGGRGSRRGSR